MTRLSLIAAACAGVGLMFMALLGVADIIGTQFFGKPVHGAVELTKGLMVFCIMLGIAQAEARGKHIRVEVAIGLLPRRAQRWFDVLAPLSMAILFAAVAWGGWDMLRQSIANQEHSEGLIKIPFWPARLALAVGATMMVAQCLVNVRKVLRRAVDQPLDSVQPPL